MSNFPNDYDDDTTLPFVNDNITEIGGEAINALRDAVFSIEQEIGIGVDGYTKASGTAGSIAQRLGISLNPNGTLKPSAIAGLGLVTLPITNSQIDANAQILESKLKLNYRTADLFNYIRDLADNINSSLGWISISGIKLEPHLLGVIYRHSADHIDISSSASNYLENKYTTPSIKSYRDNSNLLTALLDLNGELLFHQFADGYPLLSTTITTNSGTILDANYAHPAEGIFINTDRFQIIPQTTNDMQLLAQYIDDNVMIINGSKIQNLYTNGISRSSRSSKLGSQSIAPTIVETTPVIAHLRNTGAAGNPVDDINYGDDIIEFKPLNAGTPYTFDTQFSLVKPGDIIRVNYGNYQDNGSVEVAFVIKEKKFITAVDPANNTYIIRIAGKNLFYSPDGYATARIDKPLFNNNKYGVLACSAVNHDIGATTMPSLIVGSPRNAMALGLGFNPDLLDSTHYLLYIVLYPTGNPRDGYTVLPAIDVTGNAGITPGSYTLESVVENINNQFRQPGYNYRFMAFSYQGELGIMMTDCYNNSAFSIFSGVVANTGQYDQTETEAFAPNNVVGLFSSGYLSAPDPLGFGPLAASIASPLYMNTYGATEAAQIPTKLFVPLSRSNYYVNGTEKDKLNIESGQYLDGYGDGYWVATIQSRTAYANRVATTYRINNLDLSSTNLKAGKTLVIQSLGSGTITDFGRFIIGLVEFGCGATTYTDITVYDSVHAFGSSPVATSESGTFALYFNYDSVSFNSESSTDISAESPFKRHFEIYTDENAKTFTHERGRINTSGSALDVNGIILESTSELSKLNIIRISPKLRGYQYGSVNKIALMINFASSGDFDGYLMAYDSGLTSKFGPTISGRIGEVVRFYDDTNVDYIDIIFDASANITDLTANQIIDFQLFPSLSLDEEIMMIGTCQHNTTTNRITHLRDERQFGNTSEKDLSTSALSYISLPDKMLHENGVFKGFDLQEITGGGTNPNDNQIYLRGGSALVNGKVIYKNSETIAVPKIKELYEGVGYPINWAICINDASEYQLIPLLDYDVGLAVGIDRIFKAYNPLYPITSYYYLDSEFFSNIINNRKDLTILYVVYSETVVSGGSVSSTLTVNDVRKYVLDVESNLPMKYNFGTTQGNFKSVQAIFNWLNYNNTYNGNVIIRGADTSIEEPYGPTITKNITIGGEDIGTIVIDGNSRANINFTGNVTIGPNVTFKNITLRFSGQLIFASECSNIVFENCSITLAPTATPTNNIICDISSANNILFENSVISAFFPTIYSGGSVFNLTGCQNFKFFESSIDTSFVLDPGTANPPGNTFTFDNCHNIYIEDSNFSGNFARFVKFNDLCDRMYINRCVVTSSYDPQYDTDIYDSTNLVNSGYGYIQSTISSTLDNIYIENTKFNYTPDVASAHRFSFINFELSANVAVIKNVKIHTCTFNDNNFAVTDDAIRSAISIINTCPANIDVNIPQPTITNLSINGNICNKNQSIIITSQTDVSGYMVYPGLMAQNCAITNNTCGTIGYWIYSGSKYPNIVPLTNSLNDKSSNLIIANNSCHYIASMDHKGSYFAASKKVSGTTTNMCQYTSGFVSIKNNNANWIHASIAYEHNAFLEISGNNLYAYDPDYVTQFGESTTDPINVYNYAISVISSVYNATYGLGNGSSCIISNNTTNIGRWMTTDMLSNYATYYYGGIYSRSSSTITHNILKGIDGYVDNVGYNMISLGGKVNICTHNQLYRGTADIGAYIGFVVDTVPAWYGIIGSSGIVTHNFLDKPWIDSLNTNEAVFDLPYTYAWTIERNINQTVTRSINFVQALQLWSTNGSSHKLWNLPSGLDAATTNAAPNRMQITYDSSVLSGAKRYYTMKMDLSTSIPTDVKLTSLSLTLTGTVSTPPTTFSAALTAYTYIPPSTPYSVTTSHNFSSGGDTTTLLIEDPTLWLFSNYQSGSTGYLYADLTVCFEDASTTIDMSVDANELVIKYRW